MVAVECGPAGVPSDAIVVGLIDAPRIEITVKATYDDAHGIESWWEARVKVVPLRRMRTSEKVELAPVFLSSDPAGCINGVRLNVDGGLSVSLKH